MKHKKQPHQNIIWHNPEAIESPGEGYRFLVPEEVGTFSPIDVWEWSRKKEWGTSHGMPDSKGWTYRVPITTPLPDGTILTNATTEPQQPAIETILHSCLSPEAIVTELRKLLPKPQEPYEAAFDYYWAKEPRAGQHKQEAKRAFLAGWAAMEGGVA
jgi:hypothetical protein